MNAIVAVAELDPWPLQVSLHSRQGQLFGAVEEPLHVAPLVYLDAEGKPRRKAVWEKWSALQNIVSRIRRHDLMKTREVGAVSIERLKGGSGFVAHPGGNGWMRLHFPLVTNPLAFVYSGPMQAHLEAGVLYWINTAFPTAEINLGDRPRLHLVVEFREKEQNL